MKRLFLAVAILLAVSCASETSSIRRAIKHQLDVYPESRVQDIYKSFCQDALGPEHLIPNPDAARHYLQSELAEYGTDLDNNLYTVPSHRFFPTGNEGNYVRVDLSVVLDGLVSEEELLDAFVRSANGGHKISQEQWKARWGIIGAVIRNYFPDIPNEEEDLADLDSLVAEGHFIMRHSQAFRDAYHPHYRIIAKDLLNELNIIP